MASEPDSDSKKFEVLGVDDSRAEKIASAINSDKSREILRKLSNNPLTASELSKELDTSIQNIKHHINKLKEAGLIYIKETRFSKKRNKMKVYSATETPLIIFPSTTEKKAELTKILKRFFTLTGILAIISVLINKFLQTRSSLALSGRKTDAVESQSTPVPQPTSTLPLRLLILQPHLHLHLLW